MECIHLLFYHIPAGISTLSGNFQEYITVTRIECAKPIQFIRPEETAMHESLTVPSVRFPDLRFERCADYSRLAETLTMLEMKYRCVRVTGIGESMLGRSIYAVTLGAADMPGVLYIGGIGAQDFSSTSALVRFVSDYAQFLEHGRQIYGVSMSRLFRTRCITVIPMLNPDGIAIARKNAVPLHAVDTPPEEWCGNARNAGLMPDFESALREPESGAVMGLVQTMGNFGLCLSMDPEEEGISCDPGVPRSVPVARLLSRMIGCDVRKTSRGIAKWFASSCGKPAFTCGFGCDPVTLYTSVKEALFSSPLLI